MVPEFEPQDPSISTNQIPPQLPGTKPPTKEYTGGTYGSSCICSRGWPNLASINGRGGPWSCGGSMPQHRGMLRQLSLLSPTSRKEQRHSILLKAVYSGTFQHASRNLSLAPNHNPLYNPSTMPHQLSPRNLSSLAFVKWPNLASW